MTEENFETRYLHWLLMLDKWCLKHSISREQAVSVLFDDSPHNPEDPSKDLVTAKRLYWAETQQFLAKFLIKSGSVERSVTLTKVEIGDIVQAGDFREYADGGLLPCTGTVGERILDGDKVWRLRDPHSNAQEVGWVMKGPSGRLLMETLSKTKEEAETKFASPDLEKSGWRAIKIK